MFALSESDRKMTRSSAPPLRIAYMYATALWRVMLILEARIPLVIAGHWSAIM